MPETEFNGRSLLTVDSKGRLFLPQTYRDILGEKFVLSLSEDLKTLAFYRSETWQSKSEKLRRIPETDRKAHKLLRMVFSSTYPSLSADAQGRVLIPQAMRQDFALTEGTEVALVGAGSTLEIWNAKALRQDYSRITDEEADDMLDHVYSKYYLSENGRTQNEQQ